MGAGHSNQRRVAAIAAVLGVSALAMWFAMNPPDSEEDEERVEDVRFPDIEGMEGPGGHRGSGGSGRGADGRWEAGGPGGGGAGGSGPRREPPPTVGPLELYRQESVYPPTSRPLTYESHNDKIEWNARAEQGRPTDTDGDVSFIYTADRLFAIGDVAIESYLEVRRDGQPIEVTIQQATATTFVESPTGPDLESQGIPLQYEWNGTRYLQSFRPAALEGLERTVRLRMAITFDHGGPMPQSAFIDFLYTPEQSEPAFFTGRFREAIEEGSLAIYAGIRVERAGWYNIDANLWDAEESPIAWTRFKGNLAAGNHEVRLEFFGRVIAESSGTPPFHLGQLRGLRYDETHSPAEDAMPPYDGTYTTSTYSLDQFSDAPYEDPRAALIEGTLAREEEAGLGPRAPVESVNNSADNVDRRAGMIEMPGL